MPDRVLPAIGWWRDADRPLPLPPWWRWGEHDHPRLRDIRESFVKSVPNRTRALTDSEAERFAGAETVKSRYGRPFMALCHDWLEAINNADDLQRLTGCRRITNAKPGKWPFWTPASREDACAAASLVDGIIGPLYTAAHDFVWLLSESDRDADTLGELRYKMLSLVRDAVIARGGDFLLNLTPQSWVEALEELRPELEALLQPDPVLPAGAAVDGAADAGSVETRDATGGAGSDEPLWPSVPIEILNGDAPPVDPDAVAVTILDAALDGVTLPHEVPDPPQVPDGVSQERALQIIHKAVTDKLRKSNRERFFDECYGYSLFVLVRRFGWFDHTVSASHLRWETARATGTWLTDHHDRTTTPTSDLSGPEGDELPIPSTHVTAQPEHAVELVRLTGLRLGYLRQLDRRGSTGDERAILQQLFDDATSDAGLELSRRGNIGRRITWLIEQNGHRRADGSAFTRRDKTRLGRTFRIAAWNAYLDHESTGNIRGSDADRWNDSRLRDVEEPDDIDPDDSAPHGPDTSNS